jgi:hypothetical protein
MSFHVVRVADRGLALTARGQAPHSQATVVCADTAAPGRAAAPGATVLARAATATASGVLPPLSLPVVPPVAARGPAAAAGRGSPRLAVSASALPRGLTFRVLA